MRRYLTQHGVADSRLYLETQSTDTRENLTFSFRIAEAEGFRALTVVSNGFHLYRCRHLAAGMGCEVGTIGAPVPKVGLLPVACYVREYCSVMVMYGREIF